jgi:mono/diheme cytochrome c family protein
MVEMFPSFAPPRAVVLALAVVLVHAAAAAAQDVAAYFDENCGACHTIGDGELNGPDLKGVTKVRETDWLRRFIANPEAVVETGDPIAAELLRKYDGALMPALDGLTPTLVDGLIQHIARLSGDSDAPAAGREPVEAPFTGTEVGAGEELFIGRARLARGGAACSACHAVEPRALFGGGRLGPELTRVHERMRGTRGLTAWLKAPPTPVMRRLFDKQPLADDEVRALTAYFERVAASPPQSPPRISGPFLFSGLLGAILGLVVLDRTWRARLGRFRRDDRRIPSR